MYFSDAQSNECLVTRHILDIVATYINDDWKKLSEKLGIKVNLLLRLFRINKSNKENMIEIFKKLGNKIFWKDLKENLLLCDRDDIVQQIENESVVKISKYVIKSNLYSDQSYFTMLGLEVFTLAKMFLCSLRQCFWGEMGVIPPPGINS